MTTTDLCPCQKKESDMREAAAKDTCEGCRDFGEPTVNGEAVLWHEEDEEECFAPSIRAIHLQPCTCSPGIVAAAREYRAEHIKWECDCVDPREPCDACKRKDAAEDTLIRAVEEEDRQAKMAAHGVTEQDVAESVYEEDRS